MAMMLGTATATLTKTEAGSQQPAMVTIPIQTVASTCGDLLLIRVTYVTGSSSFYEFAMNADIP
jgi:hypothetical protein